MPVRIPSCCKLFFRLIIGALLVKPAVVAQPVAKVDLSGHWQGVMMKPDGEERIVLTMKKDGKAYQGQFSLVDKPGLELYLDYMYLKGSKLRFDRNIKDGYDGYEGTLSPDSQSIDGAWFHFDKPMPLRLHRVQYGEVMWQVRPPTPSDLHNLLQAAWKQSALTRDGSKPFHLTAKITIGGKDATLDDLWQDSLHWKMEVSTDKEHFVEVSNGSKSYSSGQPPIIPVLSDSRSDGDRSFALILPRIQEALFSSVRPELRESQRIKVGGGIVCDNNIIMDCTCLHVEPQLKGASDAAETEYCLSAYDGRIRQAIYPKGNENTSYGNDDGRDKFSEFGSLRVPRKLEITTSAHTLTAYVEVVELTSVTDFSSLNREPPRGFQKIAPLSQENMLRSQLMLGQELSSPTVPFNFCVSPSGQATKIDVVLHVGADGKVQGFDTVGAENGCTDAAHRQMLSHMVQQFRFRSSYQNQRAVPVDRTVRIGHEAGEYD